ncbi:hypothetical protein E2C01_017720 [Portunus trituberculatus]|uniref:Uncharacterized protein n=1 Tax=Portunus trituberculatus TaxID=210409 RepID=A0A5B7DSR0_PORTR|nr:hypothetical protein [Portunus trituberculatus]
MNAVKHGLTALDSRGEKMTNLAQINKKICNFLDRGVGNEEKPLYLKYRLTVPTLSAETRGDHMETTVEPVGVGLSQEIPPKWKASGWLS